MKIDGPLSFPENRQPEGVERPGSSPAQRPADRAKLTHDEARFSVDRETVERLKAELSCVPDVRQERVEALSRAIREGRYHVSDRQIADAVFSELLGQVQLGK